MLDVHAIIQTTAENLPLVGVVLVALLSRLNVLSTAVDATAQAVEATAKAVNKLAVAVNAHEERLDRLEGIEPEATP